MVTYTPRPDLMGKVNRQVDMSPILVQVRNFLASGDIPPFGDALADFLITDKGKTRTQVMIGFSKRDSAIKEIESIGYYSFAVDNDLEMTVRDFDSYQLPDLDRDVEREALLSFHVRASAALATAGQSFRMSDIAKGAGVQRGKYASVISDPGGRVRMNTLMEWTKEWRRNGLPDFGFSVHFSTRY